MLTDQVALNPEEVCKWRSLTVRQLAHRPLFDDLKENKRAARVLDELVDGVQCIYGLTGNSDLSSRLKSYMWRDVLRPAIMLSMNLRRQLPYLLVYIPEGFQRYQKSKNSKALSSKFKLRDVNSAIDSEGNNVNEGLVVEPGLICVTSDHGGISETIVLVDAKRMKVSD